MWTVRCAHVRAAGDLRVPAAEVLAALPSVQEIVEMSMPLEMWNWFHASCNAGFNLFLLVASVCEQFEDHAKVLTYTDAAMGPLTEGGSQLPSLVVLAQTMRGRANAALGQMTKAGQAFELAVAEAHACGLALLEMQALRDLKLLVFDSMGYAQSEHGSRRLGAALRQLVGPASMLTPMMKGLDAAELMRLEAPEPGYEVDLEQKRHQIAAPLRPEPAGDDAAATRELRAELGGLKLSVLQKRASAAGVDDDSLEAALDAPDPKQALVELIVQLETDLE
jgi:hypothetical protein